jgi:hypothetical protein
LEYWHLLAVVDADDFIWHPAGVIGQAMAHILLLSLGLVWGWLELLCHKLLGLCFAAEPLVALIDPEDADCIGWPVCCISISRARCVVCCCLPAVLASGDEDI